MNIKKKYSNNEMNILIAVADPAQASQLEDLFQKHDYNVVMAVNGKEALVTVYDRKADFVICGIDLPVMDGFELCSEIKQDKTLKNIPVILLMGAPDLKNILRGLSVEANNYFVGPFDYTHLLNKVESILSDDVQEDDEAPQEAFSVNFEGEEYDVASSSQQMFTFLISTYENMRYQNRELVKAQTEVENLNQQFETKVVELESTQADLKASEEKFRSFVQMLPDFVYQIDADGCFIFVNDAVKHLGYAPDELIGKHFGTIVVPADVKEVNRFEVLKKHVVDQDGQDDTPKLFDERRTGTRSTRGLEVRIVPKSGGEGTPAIIEPIGHEMPIVEISSSGLYEDNINTGNKDFIGSVGVIRDITERKQVEQEIHKLNAELEQVVVERTRELNETNENLVKTLDELNISQQQVIQSEKLASLGAMIAGTAHELNNAMTGILYCVQYVRKNLTDDKTREILQKAENEIHRSDKIINNMLTYSRPSKREMVQVNTLEVVKRAVELLSVYYKDKDIDLSVNIPKNLPLLWASSDSLQQVLLNLLINAFDSLSDSPIKEVHIRALDAKENIHITVRDTGHGIPEETVQKIFDPFFTTKPPGKGTGLGLSVSHSIISGFGGSLTCESTGKEGTVFLIKLRTKTPPNASTLPA